MPPRQSFYGFLSNSYTNALVSSQGVIEWLPFPRVDGDAVFCRLLDANRGEFFSIKPMIHFDSSVRYAGLSNIIETHFETAQGQARLRDFLAIGENTLWRIVDTEIPLELICRPTFEFGSTNPAYHITDKGAVFLHPTDSVGLVLTINGPMKKAERGREHWEIGPGQVEVILRYSIDYTRERSMLERAVADARVVEQATLAFWENSMVPYQGDFADEFRRSLLVVRGLTYRTNGSLVAAATTSLPEVVGQSRQWDYRFVWVRDGAYGAEALLLAGDPVGCRRFLEFMLNTVSLTNKPFSAPFFQVDGIRSHGERELLWLAGYQHSRPVRIGNAATDQVQMDIEGDLMWVVFLYWQKTGDKVFIRNYWWAINALSSWVADNWQTPDASLWEFRDDDDHYLHSRLMSWVTLKVGAVLARRVMNCHDISDQWDHKASDISKAIWEDYKASDRNYFSQGPRHRYVDAALLTMALYGFVSVDAPEFLGTLSEIESSLVDHGRVYRYREDNMGPAEYPFTLAGFWLARVYLRKGDRTRADEIIRAQLDGMTDLGLFAEHIDPATNEPHGNFPQLFPHAALITTLMERNAPPLAVDFS